MKNKTNLLALIVTICLFTCALYNGCSSQQKSEEIHPLKISLARKQIDLSAKQILLPSEQEKEKVLSDMISSNSILFRGELNTQNAGEIFIILNWSDSQLHLLVGSKDGEILLNEKTQLDAKTFIDAINSINTTKTRSVSFPNTQLSFENNANYITNADGSFDLTFNIQITTPPSSKASRFINKKTILLKNQFEVMSLNALQFWDNNPNNTEEEQLYIYDLFRPDFSNWYDQGIYKKRIETIVEEIIISGTPDVIALQEIESAKGKSEIFKESGLFRTMLENLGYKYFILGKQEENNPMALTTAFVSRLPLIDGNNLAVNIKHPAFNMLSNRDKDMIKWTTRDIQIVDVVIAGKKLRLYNNHWRSKGCHSKNSCSRSDNVRLATAEILKEQILKDLKIDPLMDIVLVGDFNLSYYEDPFLVLGTTGDEESFQKDPQNNPFYNLWYELEEKNRWEVTNKGERQTLGQIIVSANLYDYWGISYVDNSYRVEGHEGESKKYLMNADGNPFRWQQKRLKLSELPPAEAEEITKILDSRGCPIDPSKTTNRRCKTPYTTFTGEGYVDHLPIIAKFRFTTKENNKFKVGYNNTPSSTKTLDENNISPNIITVDECDRSPEKIKTYFDLNTITNGKIDVKNLMNECVKIDASINPIDLKTFGIYSSNYVTIGKEMVGLSMVRAFDPRELVDGMPVGDKDSQMHNGSDMCFTRKVLQGEGGKLKFVFGRLGYSNGIISIIIFNRDDISLIELPNNKQSACK